ncbi:hypothetical protein DDB_G0270982 [Dictyostelium discoideum AX4]|uniref:Uncharacterized protein n=1 Tax=Dictyostelium discoideum TaxID=44689 RepID=Q55CW6_DICDI|nr:hypothetical protein DDB_G0270982 [Dictyostelium discoideum AX4]EAL72841.1 hypothetical protein DDB_G0270982 [Dictyostelium discoideum AX4]|eukprot:XP_646365.1 hypothetical protein DDB_G0270982 [Dictyostelium discoideum AX4]
MNIEQQQQQQQSIVERDPFYNKSVLVIDGAIQQLKPELSNEIMDDLRAKVKDLDKDNWMFETNHSHHFKH